MALLLFVGDQQQQQTSTTMTTMPPLQLQNGQLPADWNQRGIQVVQQPIQQNPAYLQTIYGQQVLMPGNILQQGFNQQPQIQVIAASGKPLQSGQITPQMLATAQGKQVIGNSATGFSGAYTLPTSQSQTLLFSPVNVFSSQPQQQQQNILPMTTTTTPNNTQIAAKNQQQEMKNFSTQQKVVQQKTNASGQTISTPTNAQQNQQQQQQQQQCVQVSQSAIPTAQIINQIQQQGGQQMQFAAPVCTDVLN